jgi:hypothetical protein
MLGLVGKLAAKKSAPKSLEIVVNFFFKPPQARLLTIP